MQTDKEIESIRLQVEVYRVCMNDLSRQNSVLRDRIAQLQTQVDQLQDANGRLVEEYAMNNPLIMGKP